jgi:hypothetical protein
MLLATALLVALLPGCAVRRDIDIGMTGKRPPISASEVRFYDRAPGAYEVLGRVESTSLGLFTDRRGSLESAKRELRNQAARLGANGVLLDSPLAATTDPDDLNATELNGVAIFVTDPEPVHEGELR